jgi:hypothetical protein
MATSVFKLIEKRDLSPAEALAALGGRAHNVLRIDKGQGTTTIFFAADKGDAASQELRARATEVKLADVTKL